MKKIITMVVLLAAVMMSAQAQGFHFGVKGGLNITKMTFSEDVYKSDNQAGFYVGPTVKVSLPMGFGVDIAALYDQRSAKVEETDIKQKSLNVPVNVRYNIGLGSKAGIYLAVGPQFGFPVSDKVYDTKVGEYRLKDANLSFNFGAGVTILSHLEVGFTYNLAAGKSGEFKNAKDIDTHNNAWQIGAAFYF